MRSGIGWSRSYLVVVRVGVGGVITVGSSMGCCTRCGRVRSGGTFPSGSGRGRPSTNGIAAGRLTERGRCCCLLSRLPRTLRAELTGTCRSTQQRSGPTSTPPAQGRRPRPRLFKRGPRQGRTRSIQSCGSCSSGWRRWSDRRMPGTFPRRVHHQGPSRRRRTMPAHRLHADSRALR